MNTDKPKLLIIAGPNGSGKTSAQRDKWQIGENLYRSKCLGTEYLKGADYIKLSNFLYIPETPDLIHPLPSGKLPDTWSPMFQSMKLTNRQKFLNFDKKNSSMNSTSYKIALTYNQILDLVRQLPKSDKVKLSIELAKEATDKRLSRLLNAFKTDEPTAEEIIQEVEEARTELYAKKQKS